MDHSTSEIALTRLILQKFDELVSLVGACNETEANTELKFSGSNSLVQLLTHCCGMMRRWSSSVNLGYETARNREQEFTTAMDVQEVIGLAIHTRAGFVADVEATQMQAAPLSVPAGREHFWTTTCEGVLLHVLEEISQHLGQAQITHDVLTSDYRI